MLFFANKMDLPSAVKPEEIVQLIGLNQIKDRPYILCPSNALKGEGIEEGLKWLD